MNDWFTVGMGVGVVFLGLVCLVILCKVMSFFCRIGSKEEAPQVVATVPTAPQIIEKRQEIIAAVSAVLAEEMGTDISAIRILSFKKI